MNKHIREKFPNTNKVLSCRMDPIILFQLCLQDLKGHSQKGVNGLLEMVNNQVCREILFYRMSMD